MPIAGPSRGATRAQPVRAGRWVSRTRDERFEGVQRVVVRLDSGRVEIGSRKGRSVRMRTTAAVDGWRARFARRRDPEAPGAVLADGVLELRPRGQVRAQVDVPPGVRVEAEVGRGDLTLWGAGGDLQLTVGQGILVARDLVASAVRASNAAGEVNLHFAAVPELVEATSGTGPVLLVLPAGSYAVDADDSAEVTVAVDPAAARRIRTRSGGRTAVLSALGSEPI